MIRSPTDHNEIVSEYKDEIFEYIRELQDEMIPDPNYMATRQIDTQLSWERRSEIILWLIELHCQLSLRQEILFLTINYLDRFLSLKKVTLDKLQLVGLVALHIAIKYEDRNRFTLKHLQYMSHDTYTADTFRKAEIYILNKLQYKLGWPGPLIFVRRIDEEIGEMESTIRTLAKYFLEAILPDKSFVGERPSITAAAAYCLARYILGMGEWTPLHVRISEYNYSQLYPLMIKILDWLNQPQKLYLAVFNKYSLRRNLRVAPLVKKKLESGFAIDSPDTDSSSDADSSSSSSGADSGSGADSSSDADSSSNADSSSDADSRSDDDEIYFSA